MTEKETVTAREDQPQLGTCPECGCVWNELMTMCPNPYHRKAPEYQPRPTPPFPFNRVVAYKVTFSNGFQSSSDGDRADRHFMAFLDGVQAWREAHGKSEAQGEAPQMDIGGSDAFHDWPQGETPQPERPTVEYLLMAEGYLRDYFLMSGNSRERYHKLDAALSVISQAIREARVETGAHPSQDAPYWPAIVAEANRLRGLLDSKPDELKCGYWGGPGSILNAYREGDVNFEKAVQVLEAWRARSTPSLPEINPPATAEQALEWLHALLLPHDPDRTELLFNALRRYISSGSTPSPDPPPPESAQDFAKDWVFETEHERHRAEQLAEAYTANLKREVERLREALRLALDELHKINLANSHGNKPRNPEMTVFAETQGREALGDPGQKEGL